MSELDNGCQIIKSNFLLLNALEILVYIVLIPLLVPFQSMMSVIVLSKAAGTSRYEYSLSYSDEIQIIHVVNVPAHASLKSMLTLPLNCLVHDADFFWDRGWLVFFLANHQRPIQPFLRH